MLRAIVLWLPWPLHNDRDDWSLNVYMEDAQSPNRNSKQKLKDGFPDGWFSKQNEIKCDFLKAYEIHYEIMIFNFEQPL